jgi:hypothetical protein
MKARDGRGPEMKEHPMTSTLITSEDLKDLSAEQLEAKFFRMARDIERMRKACRELPLAEASLHNVRSELAVRKSKPPKP